VTLKDGVAPSHSKNEHHGETGLKKKIVLLIIALACLAILTTAGPKLASAGPSLHSHRPVKTTNCVKE